MDVDFKAIGKRIKLARINAGISQEKLAEILDVSPSYMSHLERGTSKVSLTKLIVIANALSIESMDTLLCDNIKEHRAEFYSEAQELLSDCDVFETKVLVSQLRENKEYMRQMRDYYKNGKSRSE